MNNEKISDYLSYCVNDNTVFALDVGTGTIAGVVGVRENGILRVIAADVREHENRVMFDGQIHDINQVARSVIEVKDRLAKRTGLPLDSAYIAAAGRALKTIRTEIRGGAPPDQEIDASLLHKMEDEALLKARETIASDYTQGAFDYVGYAVTGKYLDGYPMSNLLGHRGVGIKLELIVTFLPRAVIDSLFAVMRIAGISVAGLMLEPDAALNAVVIKENRMLNLALVDIGAGTSDIVVTRNGNIFSYNMVPFAGDKITERICERFLTDFKSGEAIKYALYENKEEIKYTDIFKRDTAVSYDDVYAAILPVVKALAAKISGAILNDNKHPPSAVVLAGGGCRLPGFETHLAEALGINSGRVALCDRKGIIGLECDLDILTGPESITPFGIALSGAGGDFYYHDHIMVRFNKKPVRLPNSEEYDVAGVMIAAGYQSDRLAYTQGKPVSFYVNGIFTTVNGGEGSPAYIFVNDFETGPGAVVKNGDNIRVINAEDGADARVFVSDLTPHIDAGTVTYAENEYYIAPRASINGEDCALSTEVREGDRVELTTQTTVRMFIDDYIPAETGSIYFVNKERVGEDYILTPGDELVVLRGEDADGENAFGEPYGADMENAAQERSETQEYLSRNVDINGESVEVYSATPKIMLVDALNHIALAKTDGQGKLSLQINGMPAKLTDELNAGDKILVGIIADDSI